MFANIKFMEHHYIPRFYLRAFRDPACPEGQDPWLWVVDLTERSVSRRSPKNVGKAANYYAFPDGGGGLNQAGEQVLSQIESDAAPVVAKLLRGENELSEEERGALAFFMAFLAMRVPYFRNLMEEADRQIGEMNLQIAANHPDYFERIVRESHKGIKEFTPEEIEKVRQWALNKGNYTVQVDPSSSLSTVFEVAPDFVPFLYNMNWAFLVAPAGSCFVTSDNPVSWVDPTPRPHFLGHGLAMPNIELTFPLSPNLCLMGTWREFIGREETNSDVVNQANWRRVISATRFVFANSESAALRALEYLKPERV
jgi:hypothetical protein